MSRLVEEITAQLNENTLRYRNDEINDLGFGRSVKSAIDELTLILVELVPSPPRQVELRKRKSKSELIPSTSPDEKE